MTKEELLKVAKPILFNTEMVKAILKSRKTVTRRVVKLPKWIVKQNDGSYTLFAEGTCYDKQCFEEIATYLNRPYRRGDILYVQETWSVVNTYPNLFGYDVCYKADGRILGCIFKDMERYFEKFKKYEHKTGWQSPYFMPKEAARIFLKVTDVRIERLQDMDEESSKAEGVQEYSKDGVLYKYAVTINWWLKYHKKHYKEFNGTFWQDMPRTAKKAFSYFWNSTIKKSDFEVYGWDANPYVWVIEFEKIEVE